MMSLLCAKNTSAQVLSPTLTLYRTESDFLNAVDVESTETFDSFASGTVLESIEGNDPLTGSGLFHLTTVDDVVYSIFLHA